MKNNSRTCRTCDIEKPIDDFYPHPSSPEGRLVHCRPCAYAKRKESYARTGRKTNTQYKRPTRVKSLYGISQEQYQSMFERQHGRCAICYDEKEPLVVDHDHDCCPGKKSCGKCVRGLLCGRCNVGIGMLAESKSYLLSAVAYLGGI